MIQISVVNNNPRIVMPRSVRRDPKRENMSKNERLRSVHNLRWGIRALVIFNGHFNVMVVVIQNDRYQSSFNA